MFYTLIKLYFILLYSDKTWGFDQSEHAQGPIYIIDYYQKHITWSRWYASADIT